MAKGLLETPGEVFFLLPIHLKPASNSTHLVQRMSIPTEGLNNTLDLDDDIGLGCSNNQESEIGDFYCKYQISVCVCRDVYTSPESKLF